MRTRPLVYFALTVLIALPLRAQVRERDPLTEKEVDRILKRGDTAPKEKEIRADTLRRLLSKVEEYSESHRAVGLPDDLLNILKDDLEEQAQLVDARSNV